MSILPSIHPPAAHPIRLLLCAGLAAVGIAHCGEAPQKSQGPIKPRAVQTWDIGEALAKNKRTIVETCKKNGATDDEVSLLLAIAMQESTTCSASQRDATKDGTPSANYSAFNFNQDCLQRLGWKQGQGPDLNDDANLPDATMWGLKGIRQMTPEGFLAFHRGGQTAYQDRASYGCQEYCAQIKSAQATLMADRRLWASGQRIAGDVGHV